MKRYRFNIDSAIDSSQQYFSYRLYRMLPKSKMLHSISQEIISKSRRPKTPQKSMDKKNFYDQLTQLKKEARKIDFSKFKEPQEWNQRIERMIKIGRRVGLKKSKSKRDKLE